MNYRVVRISPLVSLTLRNRLEADPAFKEMDYASLHKAIMSQHYTYGDSFGHTMCGLGNEATEILYDAETLQKKWAEENDLYLDPNGQWQFNVVAAQLEKLNPDVIYLQSFSRITPKDIEKISNRLPRLQKILVHSGFPGGIDVISKDTIVYCAIPSIESYFRERGADAHLLYHGFEPRILPLLKQGNEKRDFTFIGSSGYGYGELHKVRYWELLKLAHNTNLVLGLDDRVGSENHLNDENPFCSRPLKDKFYDLADTDCSVYPAALAPMQFLVRPEQQIPAAYGLDFYQYLYDSKMTLQRHGLKTTEGEIGAMRLFQATGVGACLLTDTGSNMAHLFEPDSEVVTYSSAQECAEKVQYLLDNPDKMQEIAQKGHQRTLKDHTFQVRYQQVDDYLQKVIH